MIPSGEYAVAIIGCGPVGAFAANLLGAVGLRTLVLEADSEPHPLPRAVHLDHEMMRLLQSAGVIDRIAPDMRATDGHLHIGADGGVIRYLGTIGHHRPFGWANDYFFYQPEFEAHLRAALEKRANVDLCFDTTFQSLAQDRAGVTLSFVSARGAGETRARWVIGCDGARSEVRRRLGIHLDDLGFEEPWLVVDAEVDGPVRFPPLTGVPEVADLQRLSVMMCDPSRPATVVPGRGNHRRWEFMLLPGEKEHEMVRPERVLQLVGPWLVGIPHRIVRAATYRFHGLVAQAWQVDRVFLAGDAAHQTPPFFGQGMCHGLRDVANLVWKLDLVEAGKAPSMLLHTYQQERDTHVRKIIAAAVEAGRYICVLDPQLAARRDAVLRERAKQQAPTTAADLIPAIECGVVGTLTPGAGERFIQPWISTSTGRALLDEVTGIGWRLFVRDPACLELSRTLVSTLVAELRITLVDVSVLVDDGTFARWFEQRTAHFALVRPDFYVFGTADGPAGLESLLMMLQGALELTANSQAREEDVV